MQHAAVLLEKTVCEYLLNKNRDYKGGRKEGRREGKNRKEGKKLVNTLQVRGHPFTT